MDFVPARWKWKITENRKYLRIKEHYENEHNNEELWYELVNEGRREYRYITQISSINEQSMIGIIGRLSQKMQLSIGIEEKKKTIELIEANNENELETKKYPDEIEQVILNNRAVAAVDTSVEEYFMAVYWVITTLDNQTYQTESISSSK